MADVKIDTNGDRVIVEGQNITANVFDFIIDAPGRRRTDITTNATRRALVHGWNDGHRWFDSLTINYDRDYPDGVTIEGEVKISDKLIVDNIEPNSALFKCTACDLWLYHPTRLKPGTLPGAPRRALVHDSNDGLTINYAKDYPSGVNIEGDVKIDSLLEGTKVVHRDPPGITIIGGYELVLKSNTIQVIYYPPVIGVQKSEPQVLDLIDEIKKLRADVDALKKKP